MDFKGTPFFKMTGSGNDFVVFFEEDLPGEKNYPEMSRLLAPRDRVGADGILILKKELPLELRYYNASGHRVPFCGNAGRVIPFLAYREGVSKDPHMVLETDIGPKKVEILDPKGLVKLEVGTIQEFQPRLRVGTMEVAFLDIGVPHAVLFTKNLDRMALEPTAHVIFQNKPGTHVNFVEKEEKGTLFVRTLEYGHTEEPLACGTGAASAAVVYRMIEDVSTPVNVRVRSGETLRVTSEESTIFLEGWVRLLYQGILQDILPLTG